MNVHLHFDGGQVPSDQRIAFYRSATARRVMCAVGYLCAWAALAGPPSFHRGIASFGLLQSMIPRAVWGVAFAVYATLMLLRNRRILLAACLLGGFLYLSNVFATLVVAYQGRPVHPFGWAAFIVAAVAHYQAYRAVYFDTPPPPPAEGGP
jgi:hypothetical protein